LKNKNVFLNEKCPLPHHKSKCDCQKAMKNKPDREKNQKAAGVEARKTLFSPRGIVEILSTENYCREKKIDGLGSFFVDENLSASVGYF